MALKTSTLVAIDSLFAPAFWLFNATLPLVSKSIETPIDQRIIIKFFGMGSIVRIGSVLKNNPKKLEQFKIITLSKNKAAVDIIGIEGYFIRTSTPWQLFGDLFRIINQVSKTKNTEIVDLERASNIAGIFRLICSYGKASASFSFDEMNTKKSNQRFITLLNKPQTAALSEILVIQNKETLQTKNLRESSTIIINANAGEYIPERKYSIAQFAEVAKLLQIKYPNLTFILTGAEHERERTNQLSKLLSEFGINHLNKVGQYSIKELVIELKMCTALITNDSGPLHLAHFFNVPTVAIWGPTSATEVGYPDSVIMRNVSIDLECAPCFKNPKSKIAIACNREVTCLKNLSSNKVFEATIELIEPSHLEAHVG